MLPKTEMEKLLATRQKIADTAKFKAQGGNKNANTIAPFSSLATSDNPHLMNRVRQHPEYEDFYQRTIRMPLDAIQEAYAKNIRNSDDPTERIIYEKVIAAKVAQQKALSESYPIEPWLYFNGKNIETKLTAKPTQKNSSDPLAANYFNFGPGHEHELVHYNSSQIPKLYDELGMSHAISEKSPWPMHHVMENGKIIRKPGKHPKDINLYNKQFFKLGETPHLKNAPVYYTKDSQEDVYGKHGYYSKVSKESPWQLSEASRERFSKMYKGKAPASESIPAPPMLPPLSPREALQDIQQQFAQRRGEEEARAQFSSPTHGESSTTTTGTSRPAEENYEQYVQRNAPQLIEAFKNKKQEEDKKKAPQIQQHPQAPQLRPQISAERQAFNTRQQLLASSPYMLPPHRLGVPSAEFMEEPQAIQMRRRRPAPPIAAGVMRYFNPAIFNPEEYPEEEENIYGPF